MLTAHVSAASMAFYPYPDSTLDFSRSLVWQSPRQAPQLTVIFHQELTKPATNVLNPIKTVTTCGSGITAAAGTRITHHLFSHLFKVRKNSSKKEEYSKFLHHTCVHCEIFAPAAPRKVWIVVSESISELPLSRLVLIIGLIRL